MKRGTFKKPTPEELKAKQAIKREKYLSEDAKQARQQKLQEKRSKVANLPKKVHAGSETIKRKRRKRTERQKAEDEIWELCKQIIRKRYANSDGTWTCYTSGERILEPSKCQTGHGKPKGALPLRFKYDLRNLRPQNYHSNINLGGMTDVFIAKLEREEEGLAFLNESCVKIDGVWTIRKDQTMGGTDALIFLKERITQYKAILEGM